MTPLDDRRSFEDEAFESLNLVDVDLGEREFVRCVFRSSNLSRTKWARTRLEDCVFQTCDLTQANPAGLALRDVHFVGCKLMGIDWQNVGTFPVMRFTECMMRYTTMHTVSLRKIELTRCAVIESNFVKVDFAESLWSECEFAGTQFEQCDVRKARFPRARDLLIDPTRNQVKGAEIPGESAHALARSMGFKVVG